MNKITRRQFFGLVGSAAAGLLGGVTPSNEKPPNSPPTGNPESPKKILESYLLRLIKKIESNNSEEKINRIFLENMLERLPAYMEKWYGITGIEMSTQEKLIFIRLILSIMKKESGITINWRTRMGSTRGPLQISAKTYQDALNYFSESLTEEFKSSENGRNRVEEVLKYELESKTGRRIDSNLQDVINENSISSVLNQITTDPEDLNAYDDYLDQAFEISLITVLYHVDYIRKTYNVEIDSQEFRYILFSSWNSGLKRQREAYLQYILYSYADETDPNMVVEAFTENPDILSKSNLTINQIKNTASYSNESYKTFIDGSLSGVELDMLTRIAIKNPQITTKAGLEVGQDFDSTKQYLIEQFFETDDGVYFRIKEVNSPLIRFISEVSKTIEMKKNEYVTHGNVMAAIPASKYKTYILDFAGHKVEDPRLAPNYTSLDYVSSLLKIYEDLS